MKKNDNRACGEFRTKRAILENYDAMAEAVRTRKPYQTPLDPPPADPRVRQSAGSRSQADAPGKQHSTEGTGGSLSQEQKG